jgi:hypothetical protein
MKSTDWWQKRDRSSHSLITQHGQLVAVIRNKNEHRSILEKKLVEGIDALERGDAKEMTYEDWERLRSEYLQRHENSKGRSTLDHE